MASLAPDVLIQLGPVPITNTIINTLLIDAIIILSVVLLAKNMKKIPGTFQNIIEMIVDVFYNLTQTIAGKNAEKIFPYFFTFFIFIMLSNWSGLLPGAESVGFYPKDSHAVEETHEKTSTSEEGTTHQEAPVDEHATNIKDDHEETPIVTTKEIQKTAEKEDATETHGESEEKHHLISLNRNLTSDINATLALAIISLAATHMLSIKTLGIKEYLGRFFSLNPILLFVGILELVSEVTKMISLSFRLFGNIYAGEVVLATISSLFAFVAPLPFMMLEILVGLVQALVFAMLTMVFMSVMMTSHHEESH